MRNKTQYKRLTLTIAGAVAALAMLAACSPAAPTPQPSGSGPSTPAEGGTIVVAQSAELQSVDARDMTSNQERAVNGLFYDPLVGRGADYELAPKLATKWEQTDPLVWEFTLREGVTFHDGSPFTAADVVFTFESILDLEQGWKTAQYTRTVASVEAAGDYTVRILTKEPDPQLAARLTQVNIVPQKVVEAGGDEAFAMNPIGTGAFKFASWNRDVELVLERYDDYWGGAPKVDRIVIKPIPEAAARVAAIQLGTADIAATVSPELAKTMEGTPGVRVAIERSMEIATIILNIEQEELQDPRVRQALNYAVDKPAIMNAIMGGAAFDHDGQSLLFGPLNFGFNGDVTGYAYDPEKAKQLLAEAGYPNGFDLQLSSSVGRYQGDVEVTTALAEYLIAVGINVNLQQLEGGTFIDLLLSKSIPGAFFQNLGSAQLDAGFYYDQWLSSAGGNTAYFSNPRTDAMAQEVRTELDVDKREALAKELFRTFVEEEAPWIFLWDQPRVYLLSDKLAGWEPSSIGIFADLSQAYWQE